MKKLINGNAILTTAMIRAGVRCACIYKTLLLESISMMIRERFSGGNFYESSTDAGYLSDMAVSGSLAGFRSVCVATQTELSSLLGRERLKRLELLKAGIIYIIFSDFSDTQIESYTSFYHLPLFIPSSVSEIRTTISDALVLSEIYKVPVLISINNKFRNIFELVDQGSLGRTVSVHQKKRTNKKSEIIKKISERYNAICSNKGEVYYTLIASGLVYEYLSEMVNSIPNIRMIKHNLIFDRIERVGRTGRNTMIIRDDNYEKIYEALFSFLPENLRSFIKSPERPIERSGRIKPILPKESNIMCPGCIFRKEIFDRLSEVGFRSSYAEDIFCNKLKINVRSGVTPEGGNILCKVEEIRLLSRMDGGEYLGFVRKSADCRIITGDKPTISRFRCNNCGKCIIRTGCPALIREGYNVRIDRSLCTGCGLCVAVCRRNAIIFDE